MRYPNLRVLAEYRPGWMGSIDHARLCRACEKVTERTLTTAYIDLASRDVWFGRTRTDGQGLDFVWSEPAVIGGRANEFDPVTSPRTVDNIVWTIQVSGADPEIKAKWADGWRRRKDWAAGDAKDRFREETRYAMASIVAHEDAALRGVGKLIA